MKPAYANDLQAERPRADLLKYARLIFTKGSGAGATLALNILLARLLVPDHAGTVFFCVALGTFVSLIARLGLDTACLKNISALNDQQQRGYFHSSLRIALLCNVPAIAAGLLVVRFSATTAAAFEPAALLFAAAALGLSLTNIASETLKAKQQTSEGLFWQTACQPTLTLLLVLLLGSELETVAACFAASYLITALLATGRARMRLMRAVQPQPIAWRAITALSAPLMFIAVMNSVIELSDTLLLGMLRSASDVSLYYIAAKLAALSTTLLFIINGTIAPEISRRWAQDDRAGVFALVNRYSRVMFGLALLILLGMVALHDPLLGVFGEQYREQAVFPLLVLATGYFFVLAAGPLGIFMTMTGNHRKYLHNNLAACALNIVLNLALIPPFGVNGACFATALALLLKNLLLYLQFRKLERSPLT
jgi:O-antigen/teichoic acid export membrane protein